MKFTFIKYNADSSMLKVFGIVFPKYFNAASVTPQLIQNELDRCTFASPVFSNKADDPAARDLKGNIVQQETRKAFPQVMDRNTVCVHIWHPFILRKTTTGF